jgi:hypothetical protein
MVKEKPRQELCRRKEVTMALDVKSIAVTAQRWTTGGQGAVQAYKDGINRSGNKWQTAVDNAQPAWQAGVAAAAGANAFMHGVSNKLAIYVQKSVDIGAGRYPGGITGGLAKFTTNMGKVLAILSGETLPARGAVGTNGARSTQISNDLHQAKLNGQTK